MIAVPGQNRERAFSTVVNIGQECGSGWLKMFGRMKARATWVRSQILDFSGTMSCCLEKLQRGGI